MTGGRVAPQPQIVRRVPAGLDAPLLAAKVQPPSPQDRLVQRSRLLDRLHEGSACQLTVVTGPAGSGKSSLLLDWARSCEEPAAWLRLDRFDNDPTQFWMGILGALASVMESEDGQSIAGLRPLVQPEIRSLLSELSAKLGEAGRRSVLVLDDLHEVSNQVVHEGLALLIDNLSDSVRVVIGSRTTPPLGLSRLRSRGQLCEIRFADLRFQVPEVAEMVGLIFDGREVPTDLPARLQEATDGWGAALYVSAIGLASSSESASETALHQDRHLSEYLLEEVLGREPEDRQRFLLQTSILESLSPGRCDAVTGRSDSAQVLRQLERSSQFVVPLGSTGDLFTYHGLLRELLQAELLQQHQPDLGRLHGLAARSAREEGDVGAAIHHCLEAGELNEAAELIAEAWIDFTNRGLFATVMSWLDRWREAQQQSPGEPPDPTVYVVGSWMALHTGRLPEVEGWLQQAEQHEFSGPLPDGSKSTAAAVAIVRCSHRRRTGAIHEALEAGHTAFQEEAGQTSQWRAVAGVGFGAALFWCGDWPEARKVFDDSARVSRATSLNVPIVLALAYTALMDRHDGHDEEALTAAVAAVEQAERAHVTGYDQAAPAYMARGFCALDLVDVEGADRFLRRAAQLASQGGERLVEASARLGLSTALGLAGDDQAARDQFSAAGRIVSKCADPGPVLLQMLKTSQRRYPNGAVNSNRLELSLRELTVLRYLRTNLTFPEIANELSVSPNTVKTHVASIRAKLGVKSRDQAVEAARAVGLIN